MKTIKHEVDFCVVGGGLAGLCAAVAAARHGTKTLLMHDRPVLGGNASSEIRVIVEGAYGSWDQSVRETGIIEEIALETLYRNPTANWQIWDTILYGIARAEKNLTLLLNCSCTNGASSNNRLQSIRGWQCTTQTWHEVSARYFADCSGDSILSNFCHATMRHGREARAEFGESIAPEAANPSKMGMSITICWREMETPQPFVSFPWAHKYLTDEETPRHKGMISLNPVNGRNGFFVELGGEDDAVHDTDRVRDELLAMGLGMIDHYKNHGEHNTTNLALEWFGFIPGKRESLRYVGDYILKQNDLQEGTAFDDVVAYGGWPIDDHDSKGSARKEAYTHTWHKVACPYGIPYRSLYSKDVENLFMAGRNISATHVALCSTRVMATCALMGQAIGTAAALAAKSDSTTRDIGRRHAELQRLLQEDDCWLPGHTREISVLTRTAHLSASKGNPEPLRNGHDRADELNKQENCWCGQTGDWMEYRFDTPQKIASTRLVFDSNLKRKWANMPFFYPRNGWNTQPPETLVRNFRLLAEAPDGSWREIAAIQDNYQRLVRVSLNIETSAIRLVVDSTWGATAVNVFSWDVK